jgi:hypothetical protein
MIANDDPFIQRVADAILNGTDESTWLNELQKLMDIQESMLDETVFTKEDKEEAEKVLFAIDELIGS